MKPCTVRWTALALAIPCLLLAACKQKHEPIKPTVARATVVAVAA